MSGFSQQITEAAKAGSEVVEQLTTQDAKSLAVVPEDKSGWLDVFSQKVVSRKLMVFIVGSVFFYLGKLTPEFWLILALGYASIQGAIDLLEKYQNRGSDK